MRTLALVFAVLASSIASAATTDGAAKPASLTFVSSVPTLDGALFGIDSVDGENRGYGQKLATSVSAGRRLVRFTCPGAMPGADRSEISFEFEPGRSYELVCTSAAAPEIRPSDC